MGSLTVLYSIGLWAALVAMIVGAFKPEAVLNGLQPHQQTRLFVFGRHGVILIAFALLEYAADKWNGDVGFILSAGACGGLLATQASLVSTKLANLNKRLAQKLGFNNNDKLKKEADGITVEWEDEEDLESFDSSINGSVGGSEDIHIIPSFTDPGVEYIVDTEKLTCTCPNFQNRKYRSKKDPKRLCKHLTQVLNETGCPDGLETDRFFFTGTIDGRPIQARIQKGSEWADVFFDGERHGYHLAGGHWTNKTRDLPEFDEMAHWALENIG